MMLFGTSGESTLARTVGLAGGLIAGGFLGLLLGIGGGLAFGGNACLRHLALRALLVRNGAAPWRYVGFLNDMTDGFSTKPGVATSSSMGCCAATSPASRP
jgi:hypothetical protein